MHTDTVKCDHLHVCPAPSRQTMPARLDVHRECLAVAKAAGSPFLHSNKIFFLATSYIYRNGQLLEFVTIIMSSSLRSRSLVVSLAITASYLALAKAQCYYPGGAWASDQFPCNKYAYTTLCCPTGWTCFSNNLCIATDPSVVSSSLPLGTAIRGTCTNPLWDNTVCGDFCLSKY